jgi:hypothetical protein
VVDALKKQPRQNGEWKTGPGRTDNEYDWRTTMLDFMDEVSGVSGVTVEAREGRM